MQKLKDGHLDRKNKDNMQLMVEGLVTMQMMDMMATYGADLVKGTALKGKDGKPLSDVQVMAKAGTDFAKSYNKPGKIAGNEWIFADKPIIDQTCSANRSSRL